LRVRGAGVTELATYHTVVEPIPPEVLHHVLGGDRVDAITFTSSSTVRGLIESLTASGFEPHEALQGVVLAAIGPITAATLREYALEPAIVGEEYSIPGLVRALAIYFASASSVRPHKGE